jgi:aminomuconate-semialdehyde/2-hydroxymuconate-6-semialdehyde dehydrogenase
VADAVFLNTGQVCLCAERVYVERKVFSAFVEALKRKRRVCIAGWPNDEKTNLGPLISRNIARRCSPTTDWRAKKARR